DLRRPAASGRRQPGGLLETLRRLLHRLAADQRGQQPAADAGVAALPAATGIPAPVRAADAAAGAAAPAVASIPVAADAVVDGGLGTAGLSLLRHSRMLEGTRQPRQTGAGHRGRR